MKVLKHHHVTLCTIPQTFHGVGSGTVASPMIAYEDRARSCLFEYPGGAWTRGVSNRTEGACVGFMNIKSVPADFEEGYVTSSRSNFGCLRN